MIILAILKLPYIFLSVSSFIIGQGAFSKNLYSFVHKVRITPEDLSQDLTALYIKVFPKTNCKGLSQDLMCLKVQDLDGRVVSKQQLRPHAHCLFLCYGFLFQSIPDICYNILVILWHFFGYFYYQNFLVTFLVNTSNVAPFWAFWPSGVKLEPFLPFLWRIFSKTLFFLGAFALFQMLVCLCNLFQRSLCPAFFLSLQLLGWQTGWQLSQAVLGCQTFWGNLNHPQKGHCSFPAASFSFCFQKQNPKELELFAFSKAEAFPKASAFPKALVPPFSKGGKDSSCKPLSISAISSLDSLAAKRACRPSLFTFLTCIKMHVSLSTLRLAHTSPLWVVVFNFGFLTKRDSKACLIGLMWQDPDGSAFTKAFQRSKQCNRPLGSGA